MNLFELYHFHRDMTPSHTNVHAAKRQFFEPVYKNVVNSAESRAEPGNVGRYREEDDTNDSIQFKCHSLSIY